MVISVWDDDYGISVHSKHQTTKENISEILKGFQRTEDQKGFEIIRVKGWDYPALIEAYEKAEQIAREEHVPVLVHVRELTQPQGHSTSGSHERYKNEARLNWERDFDCIKKMRDWMEQYGLATAEELDEIEKEGKTAARQAKTEAWKEFLSQIKTEMSELTDIINEIAPSSSKPEKLKELVKELNSKMDPLLKDVVATAKRALRYFAGSPQGDVLRNWLTEAKERNHDRYSSHLYSESDLSPLRVQAVAPEYDEENPVDARIILRENFDRILSENPAVVIFGEDTGKIGDVNQGLEGLQKKHGKHRVYDTGIR